MSLAAWILVLVSALSWSGCARSSEKRPRRVRAYYVSRLQPDVEEGMPVGEAVGRLRRQGFGCQLREVPRITCCSGVRITDRVYICNRADGPSMAQVTFAIQDDRVHHLSSGGSLGIGGPNWRQDAPLGMPASPPDP